MDPLYAYLQKMAEIRSAGGSDPETSYYGTLEHCLNEIGQQLKPPVRCIISLTNKGAGKPDGGLYSANQFQRGADADRLLGQLPERGAIEVKPPSEPVELVADTQQVQSYFAKYGLVLVTNYRDFLLLGRDTQGNPLPPERYTLAESESAFWQAAAHPQKTATEQGERFREFLKRVMLSIAPLSAPQDVAWFLASYARDAKARVEARNDLSGLAAIREALEESLGMKFTGEDGEHFFRSTLVQTIFYGVFSAWVLWHRERPDRNDLFDWRLADWSLRVPFIRTLYHQVASPERLGPLGLVGVLELTAATLNRVDRDAFFQKFQDEHAVQYFYEPFLQSFDPQLRKDLGVWYTPPEIVQYQVARVDAVLREELGVADGLADPNVLVLDPCCGTGAYLVEVLKKIAETLKAKGGDALIASDLKTAAMTRVFGFEILPAPFVVSHLQLGLLLHNLGVPLSTGRNERVGVFLTNSLTGWEPPTGPKQRILLPELEQERDAADAVKRDARILVILGNPPYNAFAGVSPKEEQGLVEPYKGIYFTDQPGGNGKPSKRVRHYALSDPASQGGWGIRKFNLDDLYVRFFRLAERRIAEMTGKGVISFISNFSYLDDPSFVLMRQRFLSEFDRLWFDCMNGDSRETGKLTPDGKPDPSVFSTEYNREGIRVGTAVCIIVRKPTRGKKPDVRFRHLWGVSKRQDLLASLTAKRFNAAYMRAGPCKDNRFSFRPENVSPAYTAWPKLPELAEDHYNGPVERRAGALISIDPAPLASRMKSYFDAKLADDEIRAIYPALMMTGNRIIGPEARKKIRSEHHFDPAAISRYPFKPFDVRWCYLANLRPLFSEPSPDLLLHRVPGNGYLITRDTADKTPEGPPFYYSPLVCDYDCISGHARHFPVLLAPTGKGNGKKAKGQTSFLDAPAKANLSAPARAYLAKLGVKDPDAGADAAGLLWMHALAIGYSPAYLSENADGIRRDWPRIPLPSAAKALKASADLGSQVAALLDTESGVRGVTASPIEAIFRTVGVLAKVGGGALDVNAGDLALNVGWGHAGKQGVTMPAKGRIVRRPYDKSELAAIAEAAKARGLSQKQALALLGPDTRDVYLNDKAYWRNVPASVWEHYIGGYQVIKKWLSYREQELLGRALLADEAREAMNMACRLTALVLMQPGLDENYRRVAANTYAWPATS